MEMDKESVLKYLKEQLLETKTGLNTRLHRLEKLKQEIQEFERNYKALTNLLEKAFSDFNVDKSKFQDMIVEIEKIQGKPHRRGKQTISNVIYSILKEAGRPLHVQDIAKLATEKYHFDARRPEASISSALLRNEEKFESVKRGVWKLRIKEQKKESANPDEIILEDDEISDDKISDKSTSVESRIL